MRKIIYVATVLAMLLNVSCEKLPDFNLLKKKSLQEKFSKKMPELQEMSELGCVEYTVSKVLDKKEERKKMGISMGKRKISFNCVAYIKAGIDMKKFDATKIMIDEDKKSIALTLPQPKLLSFNMPNDKITIAYESNTGINNLNRFKYNNEEQRKIKEEGLDSIRNAINDMGIFDDAKKNADIFFRNLLKGIGFEIITIKFEDDEKNNPGIITIKLEDDEKNN